MEEQAKGPVLIEDDWPLEEPGYGMQCLAEPRADSLAQDVPSPAQAPQPKRPAAPLMGSRPRPFPCAGRPDHFPAMFARSALFSGQRQPRKGQVPSELTKLQGQMHYDEMGYEGPRLSMHDKAVYEAVVRIAKAQRLDLNEPLSTSLRDIAASLGRKPGGTELDWIWDSLERLASARISSCLKDHSMVRGRLLLEASKRASGIDLRFDPEFAFPAFGGDAQFKIDTARRERLTLPLAKWLHDFLSTHKDSKRMDLEYLRKLVGSKVSAKSFCRALRAAAKQLCEEAPEVAQTFVIDDFRESSERWTIAFTRGSEPCDFFTPADWGEAKAADGKSARERGAQL